MDTSLDLRSNFHSQSIAEGSNYARYRNPEVDRLIETAAAQPDMPGRAPYLDQIQQIIHRDQPLTFLWESQRLTAVNKRVQNVQPDADLRVLQSEGVVGRAEAAEPGLARLPPAAPRRLAAAPAAGPHLHLLLPAPDPGRSDPPLRGAAPHRRAAAEAAAALRPRPPPRRAVPRLDLPRWRGATGAPRSRSSGRSPPCSARPCRPRRSSALAALAVEYARPCCSASPPPGGGGRPLDHGIRIVTLLLFSQPIFWLGLMAVLLFSYVWPVLPASHMHSVDADLMGPAGRLLDLAAAPGAPRPGAWASAAGGDRPLRPRQPDRGDGPGLHPRPPAPRGSPSAGWSGCTACATPPCR